MLHFKTIALLSSVTLIGCTSSPHAWQGQSGSKRVFIELKTHRKEHLKLSCHFRNNGLTKHKPTRSYFQTKVFLPSSTGKTFALKEPSIPVKTPSKQK